MQWFLTGDGGLSAAGHGELEELAWLPKRHWTLADRHRHEGRWGVEKVAVGWLFWLVSLFYFVLFGVFCFFLIFGVLSRVLQVGSVLFFFAGSFNKKTIFFPDCFWLIMYTFIWPC